MSFEQGSPVPGAADTGSVSERSAQPGALTCSGCPARWQLELEDGYVEQLADEKTAREYLRNGFKVTSRPVGPWIEVTS